jgi:hypothetical protein
MPTSPPLINEKYWSNLNFDIIFIVIRAPLEKLLNSIRDEEQLVRRARIYLCS